MKKIYILPVLVVFFGSIILFLIYFEKINLKNSQVKNSSFTSDENFNRNMVLIPAGVFRMGSNSGESDEKPEHNVFLDSFWIDIYPVTNRMYMTFVNETGYRKPKFINDKNCNHPMQPVTGVTWKDAVRYCEWLSLKTGKKYRLPTEAEWEKAARGTDGRKYPWGNKRPDSSLVSCEISEKMPEVGKYKRNKSPYGCYDMVGSVWQWCSDFYDKDYYSKSPKKNPRGPDKQSRQHRVVRGGNWVFLGCCGSSLEESLRVTRRQSFNENIAKKSIGFRCVREAE